LNLKEGNCEKKKRLNCEQKIKQEGGEPVFPFFWGGGGS